MTRREEAKTRAQAEIHVSRAVSTSMRPGAIVIVMSFGAGGIRDRGRHQKQGVKAQRDDFDKR
jgi:hypothetical protein